MNNIYEKKQVIAVKPKMKRVSISLPEDIAEHVEDIISSTFSTRTQWYLDAINTKLEKDRGTFIDKMITKK